MGKISKVWQHFDKVSKITAKCKACGKICSTSGNTSNLHAHLRYIHSFSFGTQQGVKDNSAPVPNSNIVSLRTDTISGISDTEIEDSVDSNTNSYEHPVPIKRRYQPTIQHNFQYMSSMGAEGNKSSEITEALLYFICKDSAPFSTVDGSGFRYFMKVACPLYKIPARNTVKNKLDDKYNYLSGKFKNMLKDKNNITLTSDIWTDIQMKSYIGITIHFLQDTKFISGTLGVYELDQAHTAINISQSFENILIEWEITKDQIIAIVTDNGANIKKAASDTFTRDKLIPCFAHTINLIANSSIEKCPGLGQLIEKVRSIVKFIKNSVNINDELRKYQKNDGIPDGKILKLILDVKTRWNTIYYMLERFIELFRIVSSILLEKSNAPDFITTRELNIIKEIKNLLHPLEDLTKKISGEKFVIISTILPLINCVHNAVNCVQTTTSIGTELQKLIQAELKLRFTNLELFNDFPLATLLDPRFKNLHFKDPLKCQKAIQRIKSILVEKENENIQSNEITDIISRDDQPPSETFDLWSFHTSVATAQVVNRTAPIYQELYDYLAKPVVEITAEPLNVWEIMKTMYPNLYEIARQKLSIVATSVPSERLFSKTGNIISKKRNRLTGKRLSKLVFMSSLSEEDWFQTD